MVLVIKEKTCTNLFTLFNHKHNVSVFQLPHKPSIDRMAEPTVMLN